MKRWIVPLASLSAVAGALVLALFLAGVFDRDEASGSQDTGAGDEMAGVCAQDNPDCEDTLVAPDGADDEGAGTGIAPVCAPGHSDCVDTVVNDNEAGETVVSDNEAGEPVDGDAGTSISPVCAPGFPDCVDMIVDTATDDELEADR